MTPNTFACAYSEPHVKRIEIENNTNVLISVDCSLPSNGLHHHGFIKEKEYKGLGLLPGEKFSFAITDYFNVYENQSFVITISEIFPGELTKTSYFAKSYSFCYSKFSDAEVRIKTNQNNPEIQYQDTDLYSNNLRYLWFHNGAPYQANFIISYKRKESDSWTDKKIDYFNAGRGTDKCSNQKDYPNKVYDLQKAGIPKGYWVTVKVSAKGGIGSNDNARSSTVFRYHPESRRVAKYEAGGTSCNVKIYYKGEYNL
ncbi:hypothetical protein [Fibrobacter sp. UWB11]|uniref:hypothetical protein n=1 Tax=Fibrobacter sp. UWB11 TaxID=1896202 RepID=UPI00092B54AC|nr:hypothetical protein [Fibrobacter sp. UWB11]SIN96270.1 hypothetical protein SAMN05720758_0774 [Fibrobacter sp. UWB11]